MIRTTFDFISSCEIRLYGNTEDFFLQAKIKAKLIKFEYDLSLFNLLNKKKCHRRKSHKSNI